MNNDFENKVVIITGEHKGLVKLLPSLSLKKALKYVL